MSESETTGIGERIEKLREEAQNGQVEELLDILEIVYFESQHANAKCDNINQRLRDVQQYTGVYDGGNVESLMAPNFDHRDEEVLKALRAQNREIVPVDRIQELYKRRTDVRDRDTLRSRVKELTSQGPFEHHGASNWRFTAYQPEKDSEAQDETANPA